MVTVDSRCRATEAHILVVDDDPGVRNLLEDGLTGYDFQVESVKTGRQALQRVRAQRPDLVVLDLRLPDVDGLEVLERLRDKQAAPVIVLSGRHDERTTVTAFELGAEDFVAKPFWLGELAARIRVRLRAAAPRGDGVFRMKDLAVDLEGRRVQVAGRDVALAPREFGLLKALIQAEGRVLTSTQLLQQVWGAGYGSELRYVWTYAERLRKKLGDDARHPRYIGNQRGVGYYLKTEAA
jgi:two-component system KDP operon response regulator KdpE